jgi:hypothetical protein
MLDAYLNSLDAQEKEKTASQARFGAASVVELAKMAGLKLGEHVCANCGDTMTKLGSIYRCECGMMKKAMSKCGKCGSMEKASMGTKCGACGETHKTAAALLPTLEKAASEDEIIKEATNKILELVDVCDGDLEKVGAALEEQGMSKEAIGGILSAIGRGAKGIWQAGRGAGGAKAGLSAAGKAVAPAAKGVGEAAKTYGRGMGEAAKAGYTGAGGGARGVMGAVGGMARQSPGTAAALAGAGGLGGGYMLSKKSSVNALMEVGDASGRVLAKMAQAPGMNAPIPIEEIRESIEEAQAREDIPGRAKRWQVGGGVGGGVMGGAGGYGAGRLIGPRAGLVGAGLGAVGGALGGQELGKRHGAEEARADKAVAMLRALRAHQAGAMTGYGAGMRRGYSMGQPTEEKTGAEKIAERLSKLAAAPSDLIDPGYSEGLSSAIKAAPGTVGGAVATGMGGSMLGGLGGLLLARKLKMGPVGTGLSAGAGMVPGMVAQEALLRRGLKEKGITRDFGGTLWTPRHRFTPEAAQKHLSPDDSADQVE